VRFGSIEIIDYKMISLTATTLMEVCMAALTVRNLPEETHRALRLRAAQHGRSTEAEVRIILEEAVRPEGRTKIGSALAAFGQRMGGVDFNAARDETPPRAASFE
jgi:plasmid stability protein